MRSSILVLLVTLPAAAASGQGLVTDRPDFTESTETVAPRALQAEAGLSVESGGGIEALSGPELLLRFGVVERVELRLEAPDYVEAGAGARGFGDAAVGAKVQLGPVADWGLALIGMLSLPVGHSSIGSGTVDPSLVVTASRDVSSRLSLGAQLGLARASEGPADLAATLVAGTDLSERVGAFLELAGLSLAGDAGLLLHHGYTFALSDRVQLDAHGAAGLAGTAPAWLLGAGVAVGL